MRDAARQQRDAAIERETADTRFWETEGCPLGGDDPGLNS
jgi:hypothetical protein